MAAESWALESDCGFKAWLCHCMAGALQISSLGLSFLIYKWRMMLIMASIPQDCQEAVLKHSAWPLVRLLQIPAIITIVPREIGKPLISSRKRHFI